MMKVECDCDKWLQVVCKVCGVTLATSAVDLLWICSVVMNVAVANDRRWCVRCVAWPWV